jgi:hypothetical protein
MPIASDPSALENAVKLIPLAFLFVFFLCRALRRPKRRKFRASYGSLGNALQTLQAIARPQVEYSIEEALKEKTDEDDEGGPDDPVAYYRRKMKEVDGRGGDRSRTGPEDSRTEPVADRQ